jgi:limonene-1,2-epoxide hydrolase
MGKRQEDIVQIFCNAWGDGTDRKPDVDAIVDMFSPDGEWVLWVPGGPRIVGHAALRAEIDRQLGFSSRMQCGTLKVTSTDTTVMTERLDHFTMRDTRVAHALVAVFDLDADGKIRSWREYFDTADIGKQLGMQPDQVIGG